MSEVNIDELREKARTNYGIINADDLDAKRLKAEMKSIDDQAKVAAEEQKDIVRNPDGMNPNSTANPILGAASTPPEDNTTGLGGEATDEDEDTDEIEEKQNDSKPVSKQNKDELLATAEAEGVEVSEDDTVPQLREKITAHRDENSQQD